MWILNKYRLFELIVGSIISLSILLFLIVRGATNIGVILLSLMGLFLFIKGIQKNKSIISNGDLLLITIGFSALFIATLAAQIGRNQYQISSLDGPLRIFLGFFIFILLLRVKLNLIYLLSLVIPITLIFLLIYLKFFNAQLISDWGIKYGIWGGRYATYFVDPNTLGGQCSIFTVLSFYFLISQFNKKTIYDFIRLLGFLSGLIISMYAQSRAGWLAFICGFIFVLWAERTSIYKMIKKPNVSFYILIIFNIIFCYILYLENKTLFTKRTETIFNEAILWAQVSDDVNEGAIHSRLGMWEVGILLVKENFYFGLGEKYLASSVEKFYNYLSPNLLHALNILIATGPHSDLLAKFLASGIIGAFAYLLVIFIPLFFFLKFITHYSQSIQAPAKLGAAYLIGIMITGLFNETLSLKYLCSFYGLLIAIFLASIFTTKTVNPYEPK
jgi:O-antigen ligase